MPKVAVFNAAQVAALQRQVLDVVRRGGKREWFQSDDLVDGGMGVQDANYVANIATPATIESLLATIAAKDARIDYLEDVLMKAHIVYGRG